MKCIAIILLYLNFNSEQCFCQPPSWFTGAGLGVTKLHANEFNGKSLTNSGQMATAMAGIDIPLHENLRPMVRATVCGYRAFFHAVNLDERGLSQSYSIYLNSI